MFGIQRGLFFFFIFIYLFTYLFIYLFYAVHPQIFNVACRRPWPAREK